MDWRKILAAYIEHVGATEGVDFLPGVSGLTDEENAALAELAAEGGCTNEHRERLLKYAADKRLWIGGTCRAAIDAKWCGGGPGDPY